MTRLRVLLGLLLLLAACSTRFSVPDIEDMPDQSIGSIDYGPEEPTK